MNTVVTWRKKWFDNKYELTSKNTHVGSLLTKIFTTSANGELNDLNLRFQMIGFLNQETEIIDTKTNKTIGIISYNTWKTKAKIQLSDEVIEWKSLNWNNSRWGIYNGSERIVISWNGMFNGEMISSSYNPLYLLSGLFISEYFSRSMVAIFVVLFIIIIAGS